MPLYTVLCVEDNEVNMLVLQKILESRAFEVLTAVTAEDGLEIIKRRLPNLILMDINLPGMSGFEAIEIIRSERSTCHIPVIAVTANASYSRETYTGAGFADLILKPVTLSKLISSLKKYGV